MTDRPAIAPGALRNRGLVTTSGRGPTWSAKITAAGREYLREVDGPNPPVPRRANVSVTQQLVDEVVAAGGALRVPRSDWYTYQHRAQLAMRCRKVPAGKRLEVAWAGDQMAIRLVDGPGVAPAELISISVPAKVGRFHPAARAFRDRSERHEVSRAQVARATRIVHAIAVEAERRGWSVSAAPGSGRLQLVAEEQPFSLRPREEGVRIRGPWEEEVKRYRGVDPNSNFSRDRTLPTGPYDARRERAPQTRAAL